METVGLEPERIKMLFISAAEGDRFRQICIEMDNQIRKLGPNPIKGMLKPGTPTTPAKA